MEYLIALLLFGTIIGSFGAQDPCNDLTNKCEKWKAKGQCKPSAVMREFMKEKCRKTCGFCETTALLNLCKDTSGECKKWEDLGYCAPTSDFRDYMEENCMRTCKFCKAQEFTCGQSNAMAGRIARGENATEGAWPWIASLQIKGNHFCGGTLIAPNWILTASHCVDFIKPENISIFRVVMGGHNLKKSEKSRQNAAIKNIIMHPDYDRNTVFADHALIQVQKPFMLNDRVNLACLPESGKKVLVGTQECYAAGWGAKEAPWKSVPLLQQARLPVVDPRYCKHQREDLCVGFGTETAPNACKGDSGGPLMCKNDNGSWTVHGVASFVVELCKYYTAYSPVYKYLSWIQKHVQGIHH